MNGLLEKMERFQKTLIEVEKSMVKVPFSLFKSINEARVAEKITRQCYITEYGIAQQAYGITPKKARA